MSAVFEQIFQVGFLAAIIRIATPLAFATLGEMFSERAGVLNLGIEGIMLLSAMAGFTAASLSGSLWLGVLVAVLVGALMGAVHALFTVALGLSQHVCGIGVTLLSSGLAYFLYRLIFGQQSVPPSIKGFQPAPIALLSDIPILGPAVFNQFTLVYLAIIAVPLAAFVLYRTPWGLSVRMVGENPRAADSAGVSVIATRFQAVILGGALMGLAGAFLTM
ncbi:MAG: ABC transporter permease, partial [Mesorhizobium sp.]